MLTRHAKWLNLKVGDQIRIYRDPTPDKEFFIEPVAKSSRNKIEKIYVAQRIYRQNGSVVCCYGNQLNGPSAGCMSLSSDLPDVSPV